MKTAEPVQPSVHDKPQKPTRPMIPADHPDLFSSWRSNLPDQLPAEVGSLVSSSPSATPAPLSASAPASTPADRPPTVSSVPLAAHDLEDDLDEIYFPSTEPDPPLAVSPEIRQVNTGWLKSHAWSVSIYGEVLADKDLAASVKDRGILTPLQVTPEGTVISGHRRLAAAKEALLKTVPVFVGQSRGHRVGGIEEQILEANRHRRKNTEQVIREFVAYKRIETARAKERCGCRWDLVLKSAPGEAAEAMADPGLYPRATLVREVGKARDLAAKKVGLAGSTAAVGEKIVNVIDRLQNEKKYDDVVRLRIILRDKTIQAAYRHAVEKGWLPKPVKRPCQKSGADDRDDACNDGQAGGDQDRGTAGGGSVPAAEQESGNTPASAACPDTPEAGSGAVETDINIVEVASAASMDQPLGTGELATAEHLVDVPNGTAQENTLPSASETTASPASASPASLASADLTVFRLADDSEVSIAVAEEGEVIPARKVQQALQAIRPRDAKVPADRQACARRQWLVVQLVPLLNDCAKRFPTIRERDFNDDLKYAVYTLQKVKEWR